MIKHKYKVLEVRAKDDIRLIYTLATKAEAVAITATLNQTGDFTYIMKDDGDALYTSFYQYDRER